jgi:mannose-1-phosphate guanylyltransferase
MRHAVILAGGSGTRLWPASRRSRAKQFLALGTRPDESLLRATYRRISPVCEPAHVVAVTAADQAEAVRAELPELPAASVIAEPARRNTAAALGLAALHLRHRDPDAVMAALPADHNVRDEARFAEVATRAFDLAAANDVIVTIGIVPTRPETGFGYLELGAGRTGEAEEVTRFVEKPDPETAARYLAAGNYLWNGGYFFMRAERLLRDLERFMPETHRGLSEIARALDAGGEQDAAEAAARVYPTLPSVSIDYGVMERTTEVVCLRGAFGWNDVGSWAALAEYRPADADGNVTEGTVVAHDAHNNVVVSDGGCAIAVVGVDDLVVVQSGDAILVVPRSRAQDVRAAVAALEERDLDRFL